MMSGLQSAYDSMQSYDTNTLYFCIDTQRYFIGDVEYSRPVQYGTSLPSTYLPPNSLFYNTNTRQLFFSKDGASWQVISSIPSINGVELNGDLTSSDLDLEPARFIVNIGGTITEPTSDKTYEEIVEAYDEGRNIVANFQGTPVPLAQLLRGTRAEFVMADLPYMQYCKITISTSNVVAIELGYRSATNTRMGGVKAANYNEDNYSSSQIAIDSNYFLHAPKLNIDGIELTNSTTSEDLGLQKAGMVVTVTQGTGSNYSADKTYQEIIDFHTQYPNASVMCQNSSGSTTCSDVQYMPGYGIQFNRSELSNMCVISYLILTDNTVQYSETYVTANPDELGAVHAQDYIESDYQSTEIAIDSRGFLHAPKLSINGTELTNSTTAENLNLKRADFIVTVTPNAGSYVSDKTIEEIQTAYESGLNVVAVIDLGFSIRRIELSSFFQSGNTALATFEQYDPSIMGITQYVISKIDETTEITMNYRDVIASNNLGGVRAPEYEESTYTPTQVAIDSNGYLHAPKSIFTVTVLANETANMTFEQIQTAYNNGYYVQASYVGRNIPLVQLTGSTAYFRLLVSEDTSDSNLGMVYNIRITSTSVRVSTVKLGTLNVPPYCNVPPVFSPNTLDVNVG